MINIFNKTNKVEYMNKKDDKITKLIESSEVELINKRFRVKVSIFDNGVAKKSTMLIIHDLLENHFKIHFYESVEEVVTILNILKEATK